MQRKRLEDMNLLDDFLFNAVMTFPGIGERFCRLLLQVVLGRVKRAFGWFGSSSVAAAGGAGA